MNRGLLDYLNEKGAKSLDEKVLHAYTKSMKEQTIPEIERRIKENEERAAELRFSPRSASIRQSVSQRNKQN